mgnify:CR=1 FL=1
MAKKITKTVPFNEHLQKTITFKEAQLDGLFKEYEDKHKSHYTIDAATENSLVKVSSGKKFPTYEFLQQKIELLNLKINLLLKVI